MRGVRSGEKTLVLARGMLGYSWTYQQSTVAVWPEAARRRPLSALPEHKRDEICGHNGISEARAHLANGSGLYSRASKHNKRPVRGLEKGNALPA